MNPLILQKTIEPSSQETPYIPTQHHSTYQEVTHMIIRQENPEDKEKIRIINTKAFETDTEANLVDTLRNSGIPLISLVADEKGELIGHILFSPVTLAGAPPIAGLAPMAVLPRCQNKGVGTGLVEEGLKYCRKAGYKAVVVLGHPEYYPKFGFVPAINYGIKSEWEVPAEVFMVKELEEFALKGISGTVKYHRAFSEV